MHSSPADPNKVKYAKYLFWLFALVILSIFLSGRIQFWMPEYSNLDLNKYKEMALASPGITGEVIQPFVYRIGAPWLAGLLPFKVEIGFFLLSVASLFYLTYVFFNFLIDHKIEYRISFALTAGFIFNRYFFQFYAWDYFHLTDILSLILMILFIGFLYENRFIPLFIAAILGVVVKETVLILIPVGFMYLYFNKKPWVDLLKFSSVSVAMIIVFILIRGLFGSVEGESLWSQFFSGLAYYSSPVFFLKKLVIAFLPFGVVPFLFYKETGLFFNKYKQYLLMFVLVFLVSFFGDSERLMNPFAPVYFVLIGFILQQYLTENVNRDFLRKFLIYIMIISFLSSFYHLWGLIRFPSSIYSAISSGFFTILTGYLFWTIRQFKIKKLS